MKRYRYYLIIFVIAGLFVVPQLWTHKMILGADALFHYNRFMRLRNNSKRKISAILFQSSGFSNLDELLMLYMDHYLLISKEDLFYWQAAGFVIRYYRISWYLY